MGIGLGFNLWLIRGCLICSVMRHYKKPRCIFQKKTLASNKTGSPSGFFKVFTCLAETLFTAAFRGKTKTRFFYFGLIPEVCKLTFLKVRKLQICQFLGLFRKRQILKFLQNTAQFCLKTVKTLLKVSL